MQKNVLALGRRLALPLLLQATTLMAAPQPGLFPGGIAHLRLAPASAPRPEVRLGEQRVLVRREGDHWAAWVGIPLDLAPGRHTVTVREGSRERTEAFRVEARDYPVQHLRVKNPRMVNPDPADLARIDMEAATQNEVKTLFRDEAAPALEFIAPAQGRRSSAFGLRRTFNGEPRAPHRGLDIAAGQGAPVVAPAAGVVTHVGDFFFNGRTVFVDHGQGLISMFCHLERVDAQPGARIAQGEGLGTVGSSGRATGPHLHWSVFLNGTPVDPALFIDTR
jgi:murein DD-endopeptidase MepM/ murein hydrolase activator NlpD